VSRGPSREPRAQAVSRGLFITGTDTGVGKTRVACLIVRALAGTGLSVAVMKPVAAGSIATPEGPRSEDALALIAASNVRAPYEEVNPYCLAAPVSPHIAAREQGVRVEPARLAECFRRLAARADCVVVEGAGGWRVPVNEHGFIADAATMLGLPVLLVVGLRLGCLNHALLTHEAVRRDGAAFAGWIGNAVDPAFERRAENLATLTQYLGAPIACVDHGGDTPLPGSAGARLRALVQAPR